MRADARVLAIDLGIKTLAVGANEHGRFYHIGGFKGIGGIINNWTTSAPSGTSAKKAHVAIAT